MAISDQFSGLDMKNLIGGPLTAAADASLALANSTATFINTVGFDADGKTRSVKFGYQQKTPNEDGTISENEMDVNVPLLAITPIPNLQIDNVDVLFDMEVKETSKSESTTDLSASGSATVGFLGVKISVSGSVSAHESNTRSSDNSAKYHVEVTASNYGTPEGLARVLDMMAASISPSLVSSTPKDANGQDLTEEKKKKVEQNKKLSQEVSDLERQVSAAKDAYDNQLLQLKRIASSQLNEYLADINRQLTEQNDNLDGLDKTSPTYETDKKNIEDKIGKINSTRDAVSASWNDFQNNLSQLMGTVADSVKDGDPEPATLSDVFSLKMPKSDASEGTDPYTKQGDNSPTQYEALRKAQNVAIEDKHQVNTLENSLLDKKKEYNKSIAGI